MAFGIGSRLDHNGGGLFWWLYGSPMSSPSACWLVAVSQEKVACPLFMVARPTMIYDNFFSGGEF
jgi:hypothetical protein